MSDKQDTIVSSIFEHSSKIVDNLFDGLDDQRRLALASRYILVNTLMIRSMCQHLIESLTVSNASFKDKI